MTELKETTGSTKKSDEPKAPEKIINKLDGLIDEFGILRDRLSTPVQLLGGEMPPQPEDPSGTMNEWAGLTSECFLLSVVGRIAKLRELKDSIKIYVDRLNELV